MCPAGALTRHPATSRDPRHVCAAASGLLFNGARRSNWQGQVCNAWFSFTWRGSQVSHRLLCLLSWLDLGRWKCQKHPGAQHRASREKGRKLSWVLRHGPFPTPKQQDCETTCSLNTKGNLCSWLALVRQSLYVSV